MASRAEAADDTPFVQRDVSLPALERSVLAAMDAVLEGFDVAVRPLRAADDTAVQQIGSSRALRHATRMALHQELVALLARAPATPGDLRVIAALLDIVPCIERIDAQCRVIAEATPELGDPVSATALRAGMAQLEQLVRAQVADARHAVAARDIAIAEQLPGGAALVHSVSREIARSPAIAGPDPQARRLAAAAVVLTNALEQISEDAVEIAEQVVAMTSGLFQELAGGT